MENTGGQGGVGMPYGQYVGYVPYCTGSARCYDRHGQLGKTGEYIARVAIFCAVMIHRGEEYLSGTAIGDLRCP